MTFSQVVKNIRKQLDLTQENFARELEISFSTLNRWENDRTMPSALAKRQVLDYCVNHGVDESTIIELKHSLYN